MARNSYEELIDDAVILPAWKKRADAMKSKFEKSFDRYDAVYQTTNVPPEILFVIHQMEASGDFSRHLANGDSLSARTVQVPKGLPKEGNPPFTWEQGAIAAIKHDKLDKHSWGNNVCDDLAKLESYNGMGYKKHDRNSQYLVSGTQFCEPGRYVKDGVWDDNAISAQIGCLPMLMVLGYFEAYEEA